MMLGFLSSTFLFAIIISVPIAFAIGAAGAMWIIFFEGLNSSVLVRRAFTTLSAFPLVSVPLFIMVGHLADRCGMIPDLMRWLQLVFGWLRGGRAYISVVGSMVFAGISGTAVSDIATLGRIEIQMLKDSGYPAPYSAALVATCAILAPILPPSVAMVIYALAVGNVSIGGLFMAGIGPGIVLASGLIAMSWYKAKFSDYGNLTPFPKLSELVPQTIRLIPLGILPLIIVGGIVSGIMTVGESAAVGVVYTLFIGFCVSRKLRLRDVYDAAVYSCIITSVLGMLIAAGAIVSWIMTRHQITQQLATFMIDITHDPIWFMIIVAVVLKLLGAVMDSTALTIALAPLLAPVAKLYGIHELQFGVVFVACTMIGLITPPVGVILAMTANIADTTFEAISRQIWPFVVMCLFVVLLCILFPQLSLWVPHKLGF
jgi:TRAP-type transport system large permease protein